MEYSVFSQSFTVQRKHCAGQRIYILHLDFLKKDPNVQLADIFGSIALHFIMHEKPHQNNTLFTPGKQILANPGASRNYNGACFLLKNYHFLKSPYLQHINETAC